MTTTSSNAFGPSASNVTSISIGLPDREALKTQVAALETKVGELDQKIADLSQRQEFTQVSTSSAVRQMARHSTTEGTQTKVALSSTLSAKQTQLALKSAGFYNGPIDGKFGSQTREAVKAFQKSKGLNPDGVVGSKTALALAKVGTESGSSTEE